MVCGWVVLVPALVQGAYPIALAVRPVRSHFDSFSGHFSPCLVILPQSRRPSQHLCSVLPLSTQVPLVLLIPQVPLTAPTQHAFTHPTNVQKKSKVGLLINMSLGTVAIYIDRRRCEQVFNVAGWAPLQVFASLRTRGTKVVLNPEARPP